MINLSLVVVLAEDEMQARFVRRYLERLYNARPPQIRVVKLPNGRGCGEQWVREQYANEVKEFRRRSAKAATALVVVIDADTEETSVRLQKLQSESSPLRTEQEKIVHFLPKRNIETWIRFFNGTIVDENTSYKNWADLGPKIKPAAATLFEWSRKNAAAPDYCIPSLRQAIPEVRRLET